MQIENPPFLVKEGNSVLAVSFYETPVRAVVKKDGQPDTYVYHRGVMCRIETPAAKNQIIEVQIELYDQQGTLLRRKIWEYVNGEPIYYTQRFKQAYDAWKERRVEDGMHGTPLETWAKLDAAQIGMLKAENIRSLEQLAAVADSNLHVLGINGRALRDGALKRLNDLTASAPIEEMKADNDRLRAQLEALQRQMAEISEPKRRGRPPREEAA